MHEKTPASTDVAITISTTFVQYLATTYTLSKTPFFLYSVDQAMNLLSVVLVLILFFLTPFFQLLA